MVFTQMFHHCYILPHLLYQLFSLFVCVCVCVCVCVYLYVFRYRYTHTQFLFAQFEGTLHTSWHLREPHVLSELSLLGSRVGR